MSTPKELSQPDDYRRAGSAGEDDEPSPGAIRAEIERTRDRLGDTVEALGAQLNPSHLKQRVKDSVREATIGRVQYMASNTRERITETGRGLAQTIRDNPVPAALAATGISWLLFNRERASSPRSLRRLADESEENWRRRELRERAQEFRDDVRERYDYREDVGHRAREFREELGERAREMRAGGHEVAREFSDDLGERVREYRAGRESAEEAGVRSRDYRSSAREQAEARSGTRDFNEEGRERAGEVREKAREITEGVSQKVQGLTRQADETAHRMAEKARATSERVARKARQARARMAIQAAAASRRARETAVNTAHRVEDRYREAPIGMGALALAAGLAIGFTMRQSRGQNARLGERGESLRERARERISEAGQRIEGAVGEARSLARDREEGLGG